MPNPPSDDPRKHMVSTRLTDGELERLDEERGQSSRSDWIRRLLFGKR